MQPYPLRSTAGTEGLRRTLLGLVTALIVARPLVPGEDPGLMSGGLWGASGLVLTWLWLVATAGWGVYRAWSRRGRWLAGPVEAALLLVALLTGASAAWAAAYQHPAWLIAWEAVAVAAAFMLARQLGASPEDGHRLLAAVLATGVTLAASTLVARAGVWPTPSAEQAEGDHPPAAAPGGPAEDSWRLALGATRDRPERLLAPYRSPQVFAVYLALLLPLAGGWAVAVARGGRWSWTSVPAGAAAVVIAAALWLADGRGAVLAVALVAAGVTAFGVRARRVTRRVALAVGAALVLILGGMLFTTAWRGAGTWPVENGWAALVGTWRMIADPRKPRQLWLGVGPGNFEEMAPRYTAPAAALTLTEPPNFVLDLWATAGVFTLGAFLMAVAAWAWKARLAWLGAEGRTGTPGSTAGPLDGAEGSGVRWEFYVGGMGGLVLAFVLTASTGSTEAVVRDGVAAGVRSLVWFATFALGEVLPLPSPSRPLALVAAVAAGLGGLLTTAGVSYPSVAQPLWVTAALALNAVQAPVDRAPRYWLSAVLPVPLLLAVCLGYGLFVLSPVTTCAGRLAEARVYYGLWESRLREKRAGEIRVAKDDQRDQLRVAVIRELERTILDPLQQAAQADPRASAPWVELALWEGEAWHFHPTADRGRRALAAARQAVALDPNGTRGYLAAYNLQMRFAAQAKAEATRWYELAASAAGRLAELDPRNPVPWYLKSEALAQGGSRAAAADAAGRALALDDRSPDPARRLTAEQRRRLERWRTPVQQADPLPTG